MAVHTHITEGINLPRSASPNVSITAPPGTTPALLVAASRQLIREKSERGREGKPGERGQSAAFGSYPQRGNPEKHASNLLLLWDVGVITGPTSLFVGVLILEY